MDGLKLVKRREPREPVQGDLNVELGEYAGYHVFAWSDNGGMNIDMEDVAAGEGLNCVFLTREKMDVLTRAWLRYRVGGDDGQVA